MLRAFGISEALVLKSMIAVCPGMGHHCPKTMNDRPAPSTPPRWPTCKAGSAGPKPLPTTSPRRRCGPQRHAGPRRCAARARHGLAAAVALVLFLPRTARANSARTATPGAAASCRRCRCRGACGPAAGWNGCENPLRVGDGCTRMSRIESVDDKTGRSGELVFVLVEHEVHNAQGPGADAKSTTSSTGCAAARRPATRCRHPRRRRRRHMAA